MTKKPIQKEQNGLVVSTENWRSLSTKSTTTINKRDENAAMTFPILNANASYVAAKNLPEKSKRSSES